MTTNSYISKILFIRVFWNELSFSSFRCWRVSPNVYRQISVYIWIKTSSIIVLHLQVRYQIHAAFYNDVPLSVIWHYIRLLLISYSAWRQFISTIVHFLIECHFLNKDLFVSACHWKLSIIFNLIKLCCKIQSVFVCPKIFIVKVTVIRFT